MRRALNLYSHFIVPRNKLSPCSSSATAAAFGRRSLIFSELHTLNDASEVKQFRYLHSFPVASPSIASKSVAAGLAGAVSFSMALSSVVEAKEPLSLGFLPEDVVLYQYEFCPF